MEPRSLFRPGGWLHGTVLAVGGVGLSTVLFMLVHDIFQEGDVVYLYLLVVALVAAMGDTKSGFMAAVLSFFAGKFFFVPAYYSLRAHDPKDWVSLTVFLAIGLAMGIQSQRMRRRELEARTREQESALLYRFSAFLALDPSTDGMVRLLQDAVGPALGVEQAALFLPSASGDLVPLGGAPSAPLAEGVARGAGECYHQTQHFHSPLPAAPPWEDRESASAGSAPLEGMKTTSGGWHFLPLRATSRVEGVLFVASSPKDTGFLVRHARLLGALSYLLAGSLERERLQKLAAQAKALGDADHLKNVLISSVSHELRTPLASVTATITNLLEGDVEWHHVPLRRELLAVGEDLDRLNGSIGALLDLSRLESGSWQPSREWCELGEMLGTTLKRLSREARQRVLVDLPHDLPALRVDYIQWVRAMQNLLENALAYSPPGSPVQLGAALTQDGLRVWVEDKGLGVPVEEREQIFEKFFRGRASSLRPAGTGLGLAITREIVEFHGGHVTVEEAGGGGARFVISLPPPEPRSEEVA